jgi:hypothetical protein
MRNVTICALHTTLLWEGGRETNIKCQSEDLEEWQRFEDVGIDITE